MWCFWYRVEDLLLKTLWIWEAWLEALSGSVVNSEDEISPILIGNELDNTGKLTKDKSVNQEKETDESKIYNVEEAQESITSIKSKTDKVDAYITSIKIRITQSKK